ncbi:MAG TPA: hypothetical protein VF514_10985 [Bacteroidota bacterium]
MTGKNRGAQGLYAAAMMLLAGCGTTEFASHWRSSDPDFYGPGAGWATSTFDDRRLSGTVFNDSEYVYIGLRTNNRELQRLVLHEGITWWFDREGGGKRSFGVHYPAPAPGQRPQEGPEERDAAPPSLERPMDREESIRAPAELELFTGENEHQRMSILATGGIDAKFHKERDTLVYELRVPLAAGATHPFGIGVSRGAVIGLGAVASSLRGAADLPLDRQEKEGEPEGGFGSRRSGGGGGRARGGSRPEGGPRTEQLNLWMRVRLASGR